jgi:hypothetical protein
MAKKVLTGVESDNAMVGGIMKRDDSGELIPLLQACRALIGRVQYGARPTNAGIIIAALRGLKDKLQAEELPPAK